VETRIDEIADDIYRLSTFVPEIAPPAGFTFNSFLIRAEEPLLFHTGLRRMFPLLREAVARLLPPENLRWIAFGHYEADECGAMNEGWRWHPGPRWRTARPGAWCPSTTWPTGHRACSPTAR
jgi:flavorubredoxin